MYLCPPDHDAVRPLFNNSDVDIGVLLFARALAPVTFHVRLRYGQRQILLAAIPVKHFQSLDSLCVAFAGQNTLERE